MNMERRVSFRALQCVTATLIVCWLCSTLLISIHYQHNSVDTTNNVSHVAPGSPGVLHAEMVPPPVEYDGWFPSPLQLAGKNAVLKLEPVLGHHRPDADVIMSVATGYSLPDYVRFVGSLLATGYQGDIVLGVSTDLSPQVSQFFRYHATHSHLICYQVHVSCAKFKRKVPKLHCQTLQFFADRSTGTYIPDPRPPRWLATLRFEYLWAWTHQYAKTSRIYHLDARDVYFQRNPFEDFPSTDFVIMTEESHLTPLGKEGSNRKWIEATYGGEVLNTLANQTIVCSGSTAGNQVAMEFYLRAMIHEQDSHSQIKAYGNDQGFHNYLAYILRHMVERQPQGRGMVNTLGTLPSLDKVLDDRGTILNWDGTPSAVVHQYDRFEKLLQMINNQRTKELQNKWTSTISSV